MEDRSRRDRDSGTTMQMAVVFIATAMMGVWALASAGQAWNARREATSIAAAAARAGAEAESLAEVKGGVVQLNPTLARQRAAGVISGAGATGSADVIGADTVLATVTVKVTYAFPVPGFPQSLTATSTATAYQGIDGS